MAKNETLKQTKNTDMSKSKAKREQRRKEIAKTRHQKLITRLTGIAAIAAVVLLIAAAAGKSIYLAIIRTASAPDYGAGLTADGKIDGVNAKNALSLADYANISVPADEVAATAEEVEADISSVLEAHKVLSTDTTLTIADGDEVNIDFVGTVDGVEFEGGNSNGTGYDLTIGSGSFVDDFEQQLIGHKPGEEMTVEVTFPETYGKEELNGRDAVFAVTINGIKTVPALTDEFVRENISEEGVTTADGYRAFVENNYYEKHLEEFLASYIIDNSDVKTYPSAYLKAVRAVAKHDDESMLQYYNQMLASYGGTGYGNLWEMKGGDIKDEYSYEMDLRKRAKESVKSALVYQAIFEDAGLTLDMEAAFAKMTEEYGEEYVTGMKENYGESYIAQTEIKNAVMEYLMGIYK